MSVDRAQGRFLTVAILGLALLALSPVGARAPTPVTIKMRKLRPRRSLSNCACRSQRQAVPRTQTVQRPSYGCEPMASIGRRAVSITRCVSAGAARRAR